MKYFGNLKTWQELMVANFANDIETTEKDFTGKIHCVGFANREGGVVFFINDSLDVEELLKFLNLTVLNSEFPHDIYYHNFLFDLPYILKKLFPERQFLRTNLLAPNIYDTLILARYLMTTGYQDHVDPYGRTAFGLKFLSALHGVDDDQNSYKQIVGDLKIEYVPDDVVAKYCYDDCRNTFDLFQELKEISIKEKTWEYFFNYHHPHAYKNVFHMGLNGIPVDVKNLALMIELFEEKIEEVKSHVCSETRMYIDFNSSRDLSKVIFRSEELKSQDGKPLKKPFVTENGSVCLDVTTLKLLEGQCSNPKLMAKIIFVLESTHALGMMLRLLDKTIKTKSGFRIYPKQSASASSARLRCINPPIHGFGKKIFTHTSPELLQNLDPSMVNLSVRHFLAVENSFSVLSSDAKSMDLVMLAELANISEWKDIFSWGADNHFEILRVGNPDMFNDAFAPWGGVGVGRIYGIGNNENGYFLNVDEKKIALKEEEYRRLKNYRAIAKETNLAIPYMLGANQLALKIAEATGEQVSEDTAREILQSYYLSFPGIRNFQDKVANDIYKYGFVRASQMGEEFGIRLHSNCFNRLNSAHNSNDSYEFIIKIDGHHFYVLASNWLRHEKMYDEGYYDSEDVVKGLKYTNNNFGFFFKNINEVVRLPDEIFEQKLVKASKTKARKKNEDDTEESSHYIHNSATRSCMIDRYLKLNPSLIPSAVENAAAMKLLRYSYGFIPENIVLFHRIPDENQENYFKNFRSLISEVKKIFPTFIQSVTAACVARVLSKVRSDLETRSLKSYIFLSVHDSIDLMVHEDEVGIISELTDPNKLKESFIPILWEREELASHYS